MRDIELRLTADLDSATKEVAGFRKEYGELVKVVEKPLRQVNAFRDLEANVEKTGQAMREARDRVRDLSAELTRLENPTRQLQESYKASVRELQRLERVEASQVSQLAQMSAGLTAAGLDTRNLAAEQARLSKEYNKALAAGRANTSLNSAKSNLGVTAVRDSQIELAKLREQYALVKSSGELSARDLGIAQDNYRRKVSETLARLREMRAVGQAPAGSQASGLNLSRQNLGLEQLKQLRSQLASLSVDYTRLTRSGVLSAQERAVAEVQYRRQLAETKRALAELSSAAPHGGSGGVGAALGTLGAAAAATSAFSAYARASDSVKKMDAQLKLATKSQDEFNYAQTATREIAFRSQAPLEDVVSLYARLSPAMAAMGRGQGDAVKVIDAVTQSLRISGATASETSSTITQFSQALGSGVLRGEEFNSLAENSPRLLRALAEGLAVPTGALRQMASDGKLTAETITNVLVKALPQLQQEASVLPETVGGQFTVMTDKINLALGSVNTQPLIDQMKELGKTASDPAVAGALNDLGAALFKVASWGAKGVQGFVNTAKNIGYVVADVTGQVSKLDQAEHQIKTLQTILDKGFSFETLNNMLDGDSISYQFFSTEELKAKLAEFQKVRAEILAEMNGSTTEQVAIQEKGQKDLAAINDQKLADGRAYAASLKTLQDDVVAKGKAAVDAQVAVEKAAVGKLQQAKDAQLATQKKYSEALAGLNSSTGDGSYASAQALKAGARQALQRGDTEGAKKQANDALDVLKKLADAGANTYGFEGFIKELQGIEAAADKINVDGAKNSADAALAKLKELKVEVDAIKNFQITPTLSDQGTATFLGQVQSLGKKIGQQFNVPVKAGQDAASAVASNAQPAATIQTMPTAASTQAATTQQVGTQTQRKALTYKPGVNSYSQDDLTVQVEPKLDDAAATKLAGDLAAKGPVTVQVEPVVPEQALGNVNVPVKTQIDEASVSTARTALDAIVEDFKRRLVVPVSVVAAPASAAASNDPTTGLPAYARGDMVRGPGTGTSDSILARLSNGEFVVKADAVRHYGPEFLRQLNQRRVAAFAGGGQVGPQLPSIPGPSATLLNRLNPPAAEPFGSVSLSFGGTTHNLQAPQQDFMKLLHKARIKFGRV